MKIGFLGYWILIGLSLFSSHFCLAEEMIPALCLATIYEKGISVGEYLVSEKYDGVRAFWDGKRLISRQGNVFSSPAWFTAHFPKQPLDGELWIGRGRFEETVSAVKKMTPVPSEWENVKFMVFELPQGAGTFQQRYSRMLELVEKANTPFMQVVKQFKVRDEMELQSKLKEVVKHGGEGLMLHLATAYYTTGRSHVLLKLKPYLDAEAVVVRHLPGKGKFQGMCGSLLVEMEDGIRFKIGTGFTDRQRENPPPLGAVVTFKYHGKTKNHIPKHASFLRVRSFPLPKVNTDK